MIDAFRVVDDVLLQTVQGIIDLIAAQGLINLDFADIRSVMKDAGPAVIGLGRGSGEHRATDAARQAIASPLLEANIDGARGILFNISGPADLGLREVRLAADDDPRARRCRCQRHLRGDLQRIARRGRSHHPDRHWAERARSDPEAGAGGFFERWPSSGGRGGATAEASGADGQGGVWCGRACVSGRGLRSGTRAIAGSA